MDSVIYREEVIPSDVQTVMDIVKSTGFFYPEEIEIAVELVTERLEKGFESGYLFLFAEINERTAGYACFGRIPCCRNSYDLYWIVVHRDFQGIGLGRSLLSKSEEIIKKLGGGRVFIETSSRSLYGPTRSFYTSCGYTEDAVIKNFYSEGDSKFIFVKDFINTPTIG
jgi:ribosomal protein S18 acetylase RimI-like enzyme